MSTKVRACTSHASWIAALIAVAVLLLAQGARSDDLTPFVRAGLSLVVLAAAGLTAGLVGMLLSLRPVRPGVLVPLAGTAANALLLWYFGPPILCLYF